MSPIFCLFLCASVELCWLFAGWVGCFAGVWFEKMNCRWCVCWVGASDCFFRIDVVVGVGGLVCGFPFFVIVSLFCLWFPFFCFLFPLFVLFVLWFFCVVWGVLGLVCCLGVVFCVFVVVGCVLGFFGLCFWWFLVRSRVCSMVVVCGFPFFLY